MDELAVTERIARLEVRLDAIERLTQNVSDMVVEVRHLREASDMMRVEINKLRERPAKLWELAVGSLIGAVITAIVTLALNWI